MAVVFDSTVGGANANSFVTLAEFKLYADGRMPQSAAVAAALDPDDLHRALITATRLIDEYADWDSSRTYPGVQNLGLPRIGLYDTDAEVFYLSTTIPYPAIHATSELAIRLLEDDRLSDFPIEGIRELKVAVIELKFDKTDGRPIIPDEIWTILRDLIDGQLGESGGSGMHMNSLERV